MKFLNISIESFCSIGNMVVPLDNQGLVVIVGKNKDAEAASSNGSGKSSVFEALVWVLFGKTTKGGTADSVTPTGKGKGTRVVLDFEIGDTKYQLARHRKHKTHGNKIILLKDGVDISKSIADETETLLANTLSITFESFLYTTILGQGLMFRFSQLTDQNRKEILEGIAGSSIYEDARGKAREDSSKSKSAADAQRGVKGALESQCTLISSYMSNLDAEERLANAAYEAKVAQLQQAQAKADAELESRKQALLRLQEQADETYQQELAKLAAMQAKADADYTACLEDLKRSKLDDEAALLRAREAYAAIQLPNADIKDTYQASLTRATSMEHDAIKAVSDATARKKMAEADVHALSLVGAVCKSCGSDMPPDKHAAEQQKRSAVVAAVTTELAMCTEAYEKAKAKRSALETELRKFEAQELAAHRARTTASNAVLAAERMVADANNKIATLSKPDFSLQIASVKKADYSAQIAGLSKPDYLAQIANLQKPDFSARRADYEKSLKVVSDNVAQHAAAIAVSDKQAEMAAFWTTGFQEIRVAAIDQVLNFLNQRLAHYCAALCGQDIKVVLSHTDKGKIDFAVTTAGGTYLSASGGEKDRIDIATAFALLDLARQSTNWSSNILVLDEIAVFVDDTGVDRLMKVISERMDTVGSCFLISHSPIFEGYGDRIMTVVKEGGVSSLETVA